MSAAALLARRQLSEPDSRRSRTMRDQCDHSPLSGSGRPTGVDTIRGRAKHQLPCEP